jgi:hypothetical protein
MRLLLTIEGINQTKTEVSRFYIKRQNSGCGLLEVKSAHNVAIVDLSEYTKVDKNWPTRLVQKYDTGKTKYYLQKESNLRKQKYMTQETAAQNIKNQLKSSNENEMREELKRKPLNGQFYWDLERSSVDKEKSLAWLCSSGSEKMESSITAAEDQALNTHYHHRNIIKLPTDSKCRMCYKAEKHIIHTVMGCETLASSEYTHGHNKVVSYIHWTVCKHMALQVIDKYYENIPIRVISINGTTIVWDILVITD